jgi:hypothetical protein
MPDLIKQNRGLVFFGKGRPRRAVEKLMTTVQMPGHLVIAHALGIHRYL